MIYESVERTAPTINRELMVRTLLSQHTNSGLVKVPDVVIFDISNTLIDSKAIEVEALNHVLVSYGKPKWEDGTRNKKDPLKSIKQNFPNFFGDDWKTAYDTYIKYMLDRKDRTPLIEGARELLKYLHDNNIYVIIVSNRDRAFSTELLEYHGVDSYVNSIIGADDTSYTKPNPLMVEFSLQKLNLNTKTPSVIFVGDALVDIQCADSSGCQPVLITKHITDLTTNFIAERTNKNHGKMYDLQIVQNHFDIIKLIEELKTRKALMEKNISASKHDSQITVGLL